MRYKKRSLSSWRLRLLLLIATLHFPFTIISSFGQPDAEERKLTIRGQLLDRDLKEPMIQATIQLFTATDSVFVGGTVSNERGNFYVEAPSPGTYKLRISSVGYQTLEREDST